jgi:aryl carrier-like protein
MGLKEKIEELLEMSIEDISPEDKLLQLGFDSIQLVQLAGLIEENSDLVIYEDIIYEIDGKWLTNFLLKYGKNLNQKKIIFFDLNK